MWLCFGFKTACHPTAARVANGLRLPCGADGFNYENVIEYEKHSQIQRGHGQTTRKASGVSLDLTGLFLFNRLNLANTRRSWAGDSGGK